MKIRYAAGAAALLVALAGCASQDAGGGGAKDAVSQGVTGSTIKLGTTLPLTGGAAVSGAGFKAGLEAAVKEINDKGGINGRTFQLTVLDDGFEAARSVANVRRLGDEEKVFSIVVPAGSANLPGSWSYIEQKGLPVFGPVLPPDPGTKPVYLLGSSHEDQARVIVDFLADKGIQRIATIGQDNDLGNAIRTGVQEQAKARGLQVVANEKTEANSTDVSSAVLNLRKADPQAVVFGTDNTQSALVMKQAKTLGWAPTFIGDSSTVTTGSQGTVGAAGDAAKGVYGAMTIDLPSSDSAAVAKFRTVMNGYDPSKVGDGYALQAYAYMQVYFDIIKKLGDKLNWNAFSDQAENLDGLQTGLLPPIDFGPPPHGRTGVHGAKIAQWDGSTWKVVTPDWTEPKS